MSVSKARLRKIAKARDTKAVDLYVESARNIKAMAQQRQAGMAPELGAPYKAPPMRDQYFDPHYQREMDKLHDRRVGEGPIAGPPSSDVTGHPAVDGSICWTRVTSGQVECLSCGQGWDYGDADPPPCPKKPKPAVEKPKWHLWASLAITFVFIVGMWWAVQK